MCIRDRSSEESSDEDEDSEDESKDSEENEEDRDENFVIESDNIDEKLYSSETEDEDIDDLKNDETKVKKEKPYETAVKTSPKDLMSSTSSSENRPKRQPSNPTKQIQPNTHPAINDESNKNFSHKLIFSFNPERVNIIYKIENIKDPVCIQRRDLSFGLVTQETPE